MEPRLVCILGAHGWYIGTNNCWLENDSTWKSTWIWTHSLYMEDRKMCPHYFARDIRKSTRSESSIVLDPFCKSGSCRPTFSSPWVWNIKKKTVYCEHYFHRYGLPINKQFIYWQISEWHFLYANRITDRRRHPIICFTTQAHYISVLQFVYIISTNCYGLTS